MRDSLREAFDTVFDNIEDDMSLSFPLTALRAAHEHQAHPKLDTLSPRIPYIFHEKLDKLLAIYLQLPRRKQFKIICYLETRIKQGCG